MYSVMLAAMLTTTSATPDWNCHGCYGCHGCWGYNAFSCSCFGGCSCYGGCSGCWGCHGGVGISIRLGCCGGCWGGCSGGCYGCWGGCSGGGCWGCSGCYGGVIYAGGCSCSGGGGAAMGGGGTGTSATDARTQALEREVRQLREQIRRMQGGKPGKPPGGKPFKPEQEVAAPAPAHVVVNLPEAARLFVDDTACPLTSARREFDTPNLNPGQAYYYDLKAEVMRAGRAVTATKRVTVRAGQETIVEFGEMRALETANR